MKEGGSAAISEVLNKFNAVDQLPLSLRAKVFAQTGNVVELAKMDFLTVEKLLYELSGMREVSSRETVVESLSKHGTEAVAVLIKYVEGNSDPYSDSSVDRAIEILGELGDIRALNELGNTIKKYPNANSRKTAFKALVKIGTPALETLSKLLRYSSNHYPYGSTGRSNDTEEVKRDAIAAIAQIEDPRVISMLQSVVSDQSQESYAKRAAAEALIRLGDTSAQQEINRQNRIIDNWFE
jgi:HEAT repeat protein